MKNLKEKHLITRPAAVFSGLTVVSRIFGLIRDIIAARLFGASSFWDAFVVAFTFPNLFRRILGEGALNSAFVPVFSEYMHREGKQEAWRVANIIVTLLALVLVCMSIVVIGILIFCRWSLALPERVDLIFKLSQIMFPYVIFICLVGLFMGILSTFHHLTVPALSPVVLNVVLIIGMLLVKEKSPEFQVIFLSAAVLIGGVVEFAIHIPVLRERGMHYIPLFNWRHPAVKKIIWLMGPMVLGFGITQINILVDRILALILGPGSVSILYFGDRLMELPVGVFGIALGVASLGVMSKQAARDDLIGLKDTLDYSLRIIFYIALPTSVGLIVLRYPIVKILFEREAFTHSASVICSRVVLCYSLGLFAYLGLKVVTQCFYSLQDTKTPVKVGVCMVGLNFILNVILMIPFREAGLALSTAICAILNLSTLLILLSRRLKGIFFKGLLTSFIRSAVSAIIMGMGCLFLMDRVWVLWVIVFGAIIYILTSIVLGAKEPMELIVNFRYEKSEG